MIIELKFPKYFKEFWDNGKPKNILTGNLYIGNHGNFEVDSGCSKIYYENGKIRQQKNWKNKQPIAYKQWNEKGVLIAELDFPKYAKEYYGNGKIKSETTELYWSSPTNVESKNGSKKEYYENGQTKTQTSFKEKEPYSYKEWQENGTLTYEWNIPAGNFKQYHENGSIYLEIMGFTGNKETPIENGYLTLFFNNGKPQFQEQYKEYKIVEKKMWHENGNLMAEGNASKGYHKEFSENGKISREVSGKFHYEEKDIILEGGSDKKWYKNGNLKSEIVFPKHEKSYYENGSLGLESEGTLYYDDKKKIQVQNGFTKMYNENGKMRLHKIFKEKKAIASKMWDVNGNLSYELVFPKFEKVYFDNGVLAGESEGTLYYNEQGKIQVQDGSKKAYYQNGKIGSHNIYKGKKLVSKTKWNKDGYKTISAELPNHYKEFYDDGKIKVEATGTIVEENDAFKIKDGLYKAFAPNGDVTYSAPYKDFQIISEKK